MKQQENISREHLLYLKKCKRNKIFINTMRFAVFIVLLIVWELAYQLKWIDGFIFSAPSRIIQTIYDLCATGEIFTHIGITLYETIAGFVIATTLGTIIALALWWNDKLRSIADPYIVVLNSLPKIALGPVIIIWFGSGTKAIVVMAILITIVVTILTMLSGFVETDKNKVFLMQSLGATKIQILTKLVLPSSIPNFISMLKINIGLSWIGSIMGEYLVSKAGIGYLIVYGGQIFKLDLVYASTLILCLLATGMYAIVSLLEHIIIKRRK